MCEGLIAVYIQQVIIIKKVLVWIRSIQTVTRHRGSKAAPSSSTATAEMYHIVQALWDDPNSAPFRTPVDYVALGITDYPLIVAKPMDLTTVKVQLLQQKVVTYKLRDVQHSG